jgi:L-lactate dehydrogenase (cytochrome)
MAPVVNIADLRALAKKRVPRVMFDYLDGGSFEEFTLRSNQADLERIRLRPRVLVDVSQRSLETEVFGQKLAMPLILGPVGSLGLLSRRGDIAAALAAERCGINSCLSTAAVSSIEEVAAARKTPFWYQLYMGKDREHAKRLVERAQAAGCTALVFTVDTQLYSPRERDVRNGYSLAPRLKTSVLLDIFTRWRWLADVPLGPRLKFGNMPGGQDGRATGNFTRIIKRSAGGLGGSLTWKDIDWVRSLWKGPLVIKGITSPEDAKLAVEHGADGVIVSNHGGRTCDWAPSTISALPGVVEAIGDRATVLMDGGIRRGNDVLKALALGAKACLVGRAYAYGIAAQGGEGAERAIRILEAEMMVALALLGRTSVRGLDESILDLTTVRRVPPLAAHAEVVAMHKEHAA